MKTLRLRMYTIPLMVLMALIAGCSTTDSDDSSFTNGWYVTQLPNSIDKVYSAAVGSIESGETYANNDAIYDLRVNKKTSDQAILEAANDNERGDTLVIELVKVSDNVTKIAIKYDKDGNAMRSSAEIGIIKKGIS